ncbi:MAG: hypothetical protein U0869_08765 [Chloroflexota bacterium]
MPDTHAHVDTRSRPGDPSRVFDGRVGQTVAATAVTDHDLRIDPARYPSEGEWAFCRFDDPAIPALRMGFQRGGFNIWPDDRPVDANLLQLHLEVMTADGALLWLPTGTIPAAELQLIPGSRDLRLAPGGTEILSITGWPHVTWHARSADGELETHLEVDVRTTTVLPDCVLPHAVFAMWETAGSATGWVRIGERTTPVRGRVFHDHTRVIHRHHAVPPRRMYLYTTLALDDGSAVFGYHAVDSDGRPIPDYCFGIHVDPAGQGTFLARTADLAIELDADGLPARWRIDWATDDDGLAVRAEVRVRPLPLLRAWGGPGTPADLRAFPIVPLVLDADVEVRDAHGPRTVTGAGVAEHFDADTWPGQQ